MPTRLLVAWAGGPPELQNWLEPAHPMPEKARGFDLTSLGMLLAGS